jgi:hypothetical protein
MIAFGILSVCFGLNFNAEYPAMLGSYSTATLFGTLVVILGIGGFMTGDMFSNKAIQTCITAGFSRRNVYFSLSFVSAIICAALFLIQDFILMIFYSARGYTFDHIVPRLMLALVMVYTLSRFAVMLAFVSKNGIIPIIAGWMLIFSPQLILSILPMNETVGYMFNYFTATGIANALLSPDYSDRYFMTLLFYIAGAVVFDIIGIISWQKSDIK